MPNDDDYFSSLPAAPTEKESKGKGHILDDLIDVDDDWIGYGEEEYFSGSMGLFGNNESEEDLSDFIELKDE